MTLTRKSLIKMGDINELKRLMLEMKEELLAKISTLEEKVTAKDDKLDALEKLLEATKDELIESNNMRKLLERRLDDMEQYGRRKNLRIVGIKSDDNETAEKCLEKVKTHLQEIAPDLDLVRDIDRAHRIGKPTDKNGKPVDRAVIVRFTSYRARTLAYRKRKETKGKDGPRIYIDQTKRRFDLRKKAVELVKSRPLVDYAFVDVNCNLVIRFKDGSFKHFNSEEELLYICL